MNIEEMFEYQLNEIDSENYNEYLKYLNIYFSKDTKKYDKEFLKGQYILIEKANPNKKIVITPSQFINIHKYYIELKNISNTMLQKISQLIESKNNITEENRKEFEFYKNKYISAKKELNDINTINKSYYDQLEVLLSKKIDKTIELAKYYQKRILTYNDINVMIPEKVKNILIKKFKDNKKKIPSLIEINKLAKANLIPSVEIEKWFKWIEVMYFYLLIHNEIFIINNELLDIETNFEINTKFMIIKKPILEKK